MTNEQLLHLDDMINFIFRGMPKDTSINPKFLYCLKRNKDLIQVKTRIIRMGLMPKWENPDRVQEFEGKRVALCEENSVLNEEGKPTLENNRFKIAEDKQAVFDEAIKKLNEEYKDVVEQRQKQMIEESKLLSEEVKDIDFYKINIDYLPETGFVTPELMDVLHELVDDNKK